jgi:trans-2,3-dihydro-3-hydroxyanthranilate isomerase
MKAYIVDAFTSRKFEGNRAGVILDADSLPKPERQQIAAEIYASESAFISKSDVAHFKLTFFTPTQEIPFCGHNTVAAFYLLAALNKIKATGDGAEYTAETAIGIVPVKVFSRDGKIKVTMQQRAPQFQEAAFDRKTVAESLRISEKDLDDRFQIKFVNTGNWHLMVGVSNLDCLHKISYDTPALSEILSSVNAVTAHVFYMKDETKFHARNFGPTVGIPEDPATGSAAGAFGAYLVEQEILDARNNEFEILQGEAMGRPSTITVSITADGKKAEKVEVSGTAVISFELLTEPALIAV